MMFCGQKWGGTGHYTGSILALRRSGKRTQNKAEPLRQGSVEYCMNTQYNALEYAQQLEAAGVSQEQARVHAQALGEVLSTCVVLPTHLREVTSDLTHSLAAVEMRLRSEIHDAKTELAGKIDIVEARLKAEIDKKFRFQKWSNGLIAALLIGIYVQLLVH
jgi:hypothetical protein